jgi:hypothetical protein
MFVSRVERMKEYQQAWRMPVLQCFVADLGKRYDDRQNVSLYVLEGEMFVANARFKIFRHVM